MLKVYNIESERGNKIANQFIIDNIDENTGEVLTMTFQSYESPIIEIDYKNHNINVFEDYNYSKTTNKYRNLFFKHYTELLGLATLKDLEKAIFDSYYNTSIRSWNVNKMF